MPFCQTVLPYKFGISQIRPVLPKLILPLKNKFFKNGFCQLLFLPISSAHTVLFPYPMDVSVESRLPQWSIDIPGTVCALGIGKRFGKKALPT